MTAEALSGLLAALGDDPDAVAESLRREGCVGTRGHPWSCPVALFLRKRTGLRCGARALRCSWEPGGGEIVYCDTPHPVRVFMGRHDRGEYPDLCLSAPTGNP